MLLLSTTLCLIRLTDTLSRTLFALQVIVVMFLQNAESLPIRSFAVVYMSRSFNKTIIMAASCSLVAAEIYAI